VSRAPVVVVLEDDERFNAGRGAVLAAQGGSGGGPPPEPSCAPRLDWTAPSGSRSRPPSTRRPCVADSLPPAVERPTQLRIGTNEDRFREVNEELAAGHRHLPEQPELLEFVCECGHEDCALTVPVSLDEYGEVRADRRLFVVVPGHEITESETIVGRTERYVVVRKPDDIAAAVD
jgi:hypothetical protein